jgi:hypothetical protein
LECKDDGHVEDVRRVLALSEHLRQSTVGVRLLAEESDKTANDGIKRCTMPSG